jgi:hypothetical protein
MVEQNELTLVEVVVHQVFVKKNLLLISGIEIMSHGKIPGSLQVGCHIAFLTGWVMEVAKIQGKEGRKPRFNAICERERWGLDRAVKTCVVCKHESWNIKFPVQGGLIHKSCQVLGDGLVADFHLAVALRVVAGGGQVMNV